MSGTNEDQSFSRAVPDGDDRERLICDTCGWIHYENPKIVVGSVCTWEDTILLCRRAIEPRAGYWTLPAGYMEERETTEQGAMREAQEEARADIEILGLLGIYNIPRISQVQLIYKAVLRNPDVSAGPESREVGLYRWDNIPWEDLAFPTVHWALHHFRAVKDVDTFPPFTNPPGEFGSRFPRGVNGV
jgi:ADP-ribose pyrophosphatase YjhB (NUDIX family)